MFITLQIQLYHSTSTFKPSLHPWLGETQMENAYCRKSCIVMSVPWASIANYRLRQHIISLFFLEHGIYDTQATVHSTLLLRASIRRTEHRGTMDSLYRNHVDISHWSRLVPPSLLGCTHRSLLNLTNTTLSAIITKNSRHSTSKTENPPHKLQQTKEKATKRPFQANQPY